MNILTLNPTADEHTKTVSWYVAGPFFLIPHASVDCNLLLWRKYLIISFYDINHIRVARLFLIPAIVVCGTVMMDDEDDGHSSFIVGLFLTVAFATGLVAWLAGAFG